MAEIHPGNKTYFLSHSSGDDEVVRKLRSALGDLDTAIVIDSREFHGGNPLDSTIRRAIDRSAGVLVLVSPHAHGSSWLGKELKHALAVQNKRGEAAFPVVPLLLDETRLGVLEALFGEEPIHVDIRSAIPDAALHDILVALRLREATDAEPAPQPTAEAVEELVLELSEPSVVTHADGSRRARARARLVHVPAASDQREVHSARFVVEAPLGVIEADDLRWYLEDYAVWPSPLLAARALRVEAALEGWGRLLHDTALPTQAVVEVMKSWSAIDAAHASRVARRFSIEVDAEPDMGATEETVLNMREAATLLLGLPWELLHDERNYLFQGNRPVRVRRRLPTKRPTPVPVLGTPIRVLLASPRPEDEACLYIDHRASAGPMVDAMEALAGQVELRLLAPPTLGALREELDRAHREGKPYHVLHFDGHGVYDRHAGLGALCFEHEEDSRRPDGMRRHANVLTADLGALLRDHGISLVSLDACQTAQAESANESVASALLNAGIGSVVAMSHSVLVETSRRFVEAFYRALSRGERVGSAMLAGQRELKDNAVRGRIFGHGEFRLQDWFVPVLYQDRDDPQLFRETTSRQTLEDWHARLKKRLGELPPPPAQGFVGRSRELLALERLLAIERYAVLRGQGGEGKTALATEFARWRVRARQVERAAFVSVESHGHPSAVLDAIGRQLVGKHYSVAAHSSLDGAIEPVLRELREHSTLLVIDNLESVLAAPYDLSEAAPTEADRARNEALAADERENAEAILALAGRLMACGETRLVFTSREALPAPFDGEVQRIELRRLSRVDAVQLVERTLGLDAAGQGREAEAKREDIESLVDAVHGHARTLALLAPALRERGPAATQVDMVDLMAEMDRRFPGQREKSLLASVELSLRRLPRSMREKAQVLGVFHGTVDLDMLRHMTEWDNADVQALGTALIATGLATPERYNHLSLNPALCPYLASGWTPAEGEEWAVRWTQSMLAYAEFMSRERLRDIGMAATLTVKELPNLMALLDRVERAGDAEATIDLTTTLHGLLWQLNLPRLLGRVAQTRDAATQSLGQTGWSHALFQAERTRIEQLLQTGRVGDALASAKEVHERALAAGEQAYREADFDLASAAFLHGRMLRMTGQASAALRPLEESSWRFNAIEAREKGGGAARMAAITVSERANALSDLGRLDEAAQEYEQAVALGQQRGDERAVAVDKGQLGSVRLRQGRFGDALAAWIEARDRFEALGEAGTVAVAWHQIGIVHQWAGESDAAEDAYQRSLAIEVQRNDLGGQAATLVQLGNFYANILGRPEDAVAHFSQAADRFVALRDAAGEGRARSNLGEILRRLDHLSEARREIKRAIECGRAMEHAEEGWKTWAILAQIEQAEGRVAESARAIEQARDAYLAYRRDGGESRTPGASLARAIARMLAAGEDASAGAQLQQLAAEADPPAWLSPFVTALQAVVAGQRNTAIAAAPGLDYDDAAEILLLLEGLDAHSGDAQSAGDTDMRGRTDEASAGNDALLAEEASHRATEADALDAERHADHASAAEPVEVLQLVEEMTDEEQQLAVSKLPAWMADARVTEVIRVTLDVVLKGDSDQLAEFFMERQPAPWKAATTPHWRNTEAAEFEAIAQFSSGAVRSVGTVAVRDDGYLDLVPFDYWSLIDPDDEAPSEQRHLRFQLNLFAVEVSA